MRLTRIATMAVLAVTLIGGVILGSHSWNGYHWARTSNPFTIKLGDNVSGPKIAPGAWDVALNFASTDWTQSSVLDTVIVAGQTNPRNCRPTSGQVEVCNSTYGNNGWLGVAQIWISGSHITQGVVKLNDTYFNTATYNTSAWRQFVMCQEIGHTFGLDHQDENFNNENLGSCMDYTNDPSSNQHPNQHDFDQLEAIYNSHLDSTTTISQSSPGASNVDLDHPSQWGQLMQSTRGGRLQVFERIFGNGERIVTFVIWA